MRRSNSRLKGEQLVLGVLGLEQQGAQGRVRVSATMPESTTDRPRR